MSKSVKQIVAVAARGKSSVFKATRILRQEYGARVLGSQLSPSNVHRDTYPFVGALARLFKCRYVLIVGRPALRNLIHLYPDLTVIGVNVTTAESSGKIGFQAWCNKTVELNEALLSQTFVVCEDLRAQASTHPGLLGELRGWFQHAPAGVVTNSLRIDESVDEINAFLVRGGLNVQFSGISSRRIGNNQTETECLAVVRNNAVDGSEPRSAPASFRVVAFMAAYNEQDIIVESIRKWTDQGVAVHVLENWSTDSTYDLIRDLQHTLPVTVERFPREGPSQYFEWAGMLERMQQLTGELSADWFVRRGADEILASPWRGVTYRDALYRVDQEGYNSVDHTVINFCPIDNAFRDGMDHERHFKYFQFGQYPSDFSQRKAWKNQGRDLLMAAGGHNVRFEGRKVYPFKFLLKHYPVRSQAHGERKIFAERKARWQPDERARGWHTHYDHIRVKHRFVLPAAEQILFDEDTFYQRYLTQRLTGVGIKLQ